MTDEQERSMRDALFRLGDGLDAVVFVFILTRLYSEVIGAPSFVSLLNKVKIIVLFGSLFYFLLWEWLKIRLLTVKNPIQDYRRFFIEIGISFASYGAALRAVQAKPTLFLYTAIVMFLGGWWAYAAYKEYPQSEDRFELMSMGVFHLMFAILSLTAWPIVSLPQPEITFYFLPLIMLYLWLFVFFQEISITREVKGILAGPGVPFIGWERLERIWYFLIRII
jgi:hypothetical protein